jgi:hypothetical protein
VTSRELESSLGSALRQARTMRSTESLSTCQSLA